MTKSTLPGKTADKLISHTKHCQQCGAARRAKTPTFCPVGKTLIKKTLKERHG